jgi:glycosyltransferase involved in cell wall biosynthesis
VKPKILHVLEATQGGIRRHVVDLLQAADRSRFDVGLVYSLDRADDVFRQDLDRLGRSGVGLHEVRMVREISPFDDAAALARLIPLLRRERPAIVHVHGAKAGMLGRIAALFLRPRAAVVYTPHGGALHDVYGPVRNRVFARLERVAGHATDRIINVSESSTRVYAEKTGAPPHKLVTIYNGVAPLVRPDASRIESVRREHGIPADAFVLCIVALLNPNKGHEVLFEALAAVQEQSPDAKLWCLVVGDGPLRQHLERRAAALGIARQVRFVGFSCVPDAYMAASDVVVVPSVAEVFGLVLPEAMQLGKPVIASDVGGIPEIVQHEVNGLLFPSRNAPRLADAILRLYRSPELRDTLSDAGLRTAERFSRSRMVEETEAVYQRMLAGRSPS